MIYSVWTGSIYLAYSLWYVLSHRGIFPQLKFELFNYYPSISKPSCFRYHYSQNRYKADPLYYLKMLYIKCFSLGSQILDISYYNNAHLLIYQSKNHYIRTKEYNQVIFLLFHVKNRYTFVRQNYSKHLSK